MGVAAAPSAILDDVASQPAHTGHTRKKIDFKNVFYESFWHGVVSSVGDLKAHSVQK